MRILMSRLVQGLRSFLGVPLIVGSEMIGRLAVWGDTPSEFALTHRKVASEITASLAVALQQARLHEQLRAGRERLQAVSRRLVDLQETERRSIARELHDEVGQALTGLNVLLKIRGRGAINCVPRVTNRAPTRRPARRLPGGGNPVSPF
ncbi:MAG: hypothetical protein HY675_17335 [Chloroflexi bacterium]|nr:hypothetical protein [Chloroflexota bacterium]